MPEVDFLPFLSNADVWSKYNLGKLAYAM
jgi:hypothetical protein